MRTFLLELYDQIYVFWTGTEFSGIVLILKLVSMGISLFFIILIAVLLKRSDATWWLRERAYARQFAKAGGEDVRWQKIQERLARGDDANLKLAVIEADALFDDILLRMAAPGKTMDERLNIFQKHELKSIDLVWEAHRFRNYLVQNTKYAITKEQAEQAIKNYESALKELEYL